MAVKPHEWNSSKPMWAIGTIDSYGAIRGRCSKSHHHSPMHGPEDGPGHRWRWNIWGQEFHAVLGAENAMTREELFLVRDWLDRHGYIRPSREALANCIETDTQEMP